MKVKIFLLSVLAIAIQPLLAEPDGKSPTALKNAVILVIRHAEKPDEGDNLAPLGEQRAKLYVDYFKKFTVDSAPLKLDYIFATADSKGSHRPRLTVTPLSQATGLTIDTRFKDKDFQQLADDLSAHPHGKNILICWHHGAIPELLHALGADEKAVVPDGKWSGEVFGWVIQLRYDPDGHLIEAKHINENLLPDDSDKPAAKP